MSKEIGLFTVSLGNIAAMILSWAHNHDIVWMIIHGICGWLYVIYYVLVFSGLIPDQIPSQ